MSPAWFADGSQDVGWVNKPNIKTGAISAAVVNYKPSAMSYQLMWTIRPAEVSGKDS